MFSAGLTKLPSELQAGLGRLMHTLGGVLLRYFDRLEAGQAKAGALGAWLGLNRQQVVRLEVVGKRGKFIEHYVKTLSQVAPMRHATSNQVRRAVAAQVRLLEIEGLAMEGTDKRRWWVLLNQEVLKGIPPQANGQAWANAAAKAITTPEQLAKIDERAWQRVVGSEVRVGMIAGLLQVWNLTKTTSDYAGAMAHERQDASRRLYAGVMAVGGTLMELSGLGLQKLPATVLSRRFTQVAGETLRFAGKALGLVGSIYVGIADFYRHKEEEQRGNQGLADLYYDSAILGGVALPIGILLLGKLGPLGWLVVFGLLVAFIVVTIRIEKEKDNKLQEWLSRCYFGSAPDKYPDATFEQQQLELVFK